MVKLTGSFPHTSYVHTPSPPIGLLHQHGTFATTHRPSQTLHSHLQFLVYTELYFWCLLWRVSTSSKHGSFFTALKISHDLLVIFSPHQILETTNLFYYLYSFIFSKMSYIWKLTKFHFFRLNSFTYNVNLSSLYIFS